MLRFDRFAAPMRRPVVIAIAAVALVAGTAAALSLPQSSLAATNSSSSATVTDAQKMQRVFDDTNEVRAEAGTTPLVRNASLDKVAQDWAYQQWKNGAMSHNPDYSKQIPAGWSHAGENVAAGYTYTEVTPAWVKSPEHYKNLVGDYTDIGIGYYEGPDGNRYWVQEFAKYSTTQVPPKQTPTASPSAASSSAPSSSSGSSSAPTTSTPSSGSSSASAAAEPAAPAGTAIALSSPSFEGSMTGWTASGGSVEGPVSTAKGGRYDLAITGGTTVSQTVSTTVTAGETDTVTIWVKPGSTSAVTGSLKLSAIGGTTETATASFSVSSGWMQVSVGLPVQRAGHTGLTVSIVLSNSGRAYRLDSASLVRTTAAPAPAASTAPAAPAPAASSKPTSSTPASTPAKTTTPTPAPAASTSAPASSSPASPTPAPTSGGISLPGISLGLGG